MSRNSPKPYELFLKAAQFTRFLVDESLSDLIRKDGNDSLAQQVVEECKLLASSLQAFIESEKTFRRQSVARSYNQIESNQTKNVNGKEDLIWLNLLTLVDSFGGKTINSCEIYAFCGLCNTTELKIFEWNQHYTSDEHRRRLKQVIVKGDVWRETRCKKCGLVIFSDIDLLNRVLTSKEHRKLDVKIQFLKENAQTDRDSIRDDTDDNESQADTASSFRGERRQKNPRSKCWKPNKFSPGRSSESLSTNGDNDNKAFYVIDNEKIYITAQFEDICKKMLVPNASSFFYCRPCWFCTNDKDEWTKHCLESSPHSKVMEKHNNFHVVCKVCGLQLIASFKIPEAFIKYHLRVNHSYVKEQDYSDYYKQCRVRTD